MQTLCVRHGTVGAVRQPSNRRSSTYLLFQQHQPCPSRGKTTTPVCRVLRTWLVRVAGPVLISGEAESMIEAVCHSGRLFQSGQACFYAARLAMLIGKRLKTEMALLVAWRFLHSCLFRQLPFVRSHLPDQGRGRQGKAKPVRQGHCSFPLSRCAMIASVNMASNPNVAFGALFESRREYLASTAQSWSHRCRCPQFWRLR